MKRKYFLLSILVLFGFFAQAQLNQTIESSPGNAVQTPEKVVAQLTNGINSDSFVKEFQSEKNAFMDKIAKINTVKDFTASVSTLAGSIKPNMYKPNFNIIEFKKKSSTVKTTGEAGNMVRDLEKNIKPTAFSGMWKLQRNGWLINVGKLK